MIIPSFEDSPWWWQPFALIWKNQELLPVQAELASIQTQMSPPQKQKLQKLTTVVADLNAWLDYVARADESSVDESDAYVFTYIPLSMQLQADHSLYLQARDTLITRFPAIFTGQRTTQESERVAQDGGALEPVQIMVEAVAVEPVLPSILVERKWPQVAYHSPVFFFRQRVYELIANQHESTQLKTALSGLKSRFPDQFDGNLAVAACYLHAQGEKPEGDDDDGMFRYLQQTPPSLVDMDTLVVISGEPCMGCGRA